MGFFLIAVSIILQCGFRKRNLSLAIKNHKFNRCISLRAERGFQAMGIFFIAVCFIVQDFAIAIREDFLRTPTTVGHEGRKPWSCPIVSRRETISYHMRMLDN